MTCPQEGRCPAFNVAGLDLYRFTAALTFGVPYDAVTRKQRSVGKRMALILIEASEGMCAAEAAAVGQGDAGL
jgi:DNA polymerase I-like protein with 3'-5' exonuclease and polymerase domains